MPATEHALCPETRTDSPLLRCVVSLLQSSSRAVKVGRVDSSRAVRELGLTLTPVETSLRDMVDRMIELGMIKAE